MRTFRSCCTLLLALLFLTTATPLLQAAEQGEYIAIRKAGSGRIALVLQKPAAEGSREGRWAESLDAMTRQGLDFTGLFTLVPAPMNALQSRPDGSRAVNFAALNSIGSEFYAGGKVEKRSGNVTLTMAVYDTFAGRPVLSKSYSGKESQLRAISHAFCADLVSLLTGRPSMFGTRIFFVSNRSGFKEVYACDFDGEGLEQITSSKSISLTPVPSPDGSRLAFTDYRTGQPKLNIMTLADRKVRMVSQRGVSIDPGWRNSGEVATTLSFEGDQEIYLARADGSLARRITNSRGIDVSPSFSPDGTKMAFVSSRNGLPQIFVLDLSNGQTRRLTYAGRYNTQPSWSPAGDKIAFSTWEKNGEINIFTINTDGSGLRQLTRGSRENEAPSWSPGGEMIVFTSNRQGSKKLYVMNSSGENQRRLLQMEGEQMQPSWSLPR